MDVIGALGLEDLPDVAAIESRAWRCTAGGFVPTWTIGGFMKEASPKVPAGHCSSPYILKLHGLKTKSLDVLHELEEAILLETEG